MPTVYVTITFITPQFGPDIRRAITFNPLNHRRVLFPRPCSDDLDVSRRKLELYAKFEEHQVIFTAATMTIQPVSEGMIDSTPSINYSCAIEGKAEVTFVLTKDAPQPQRFTKYGVEMIHPKSGNIIGTCDFVDGMDYMNVYAANAPVSDINICLQE